MLALLVLAASLPRPVSTVATELSAHYVFEVTDPADAAVDASLTLSGLDRPIALSFPESFAYVRLDEPRLDGDVRLVSGSAATLQRRDSYSWELDPGGSTEVRLRWRVPLDHRSLPEVAGRDEYEFPYLRSDHGLLVMGTLALAPEEPARTKPRVRFDLPPGWEVYAPWPVEADGTFLPDPESLRDDLIAIGAWDVHREEVAGMDLVLAFAPGQDALRDAVLERAGRIVAAELELFGRTPQDSYLFLFVEPTPGGYGGSPKTRSMTLFVAPELPVSFALEGIEHLLAHEFHHTWMRASCFPPDELRFLVEGFTDYYAYLVPWRLGMRDDAYLLAILEGKLAELERSLAAAPFSLQEAGGPAFFEGGDAYHATYAGGLVLALLADLALRASEPATDLDRLLRDFYNDARWGATETGEQPTPEDLWKLVERNAGRTVRDRCEAFTKTRGLPDLVAAFAAVGVELQRKSTRAPLDLRANLQGTTLGGIDPADASFRIGLRPGDRLIAVNGVSVASEADVRDAWRAPVDDRLRVRLVRGDTDTEEEIDAPVPLDAVYQLPESLLARLR